MVPPKCFVQDPGKDGEDRESPVFPTMGAVECLGSAVIGGRSWGGRRFEGPRGLQVGCSKAGFLHCWSVGD